MYCSQGRLLWRTMKELPPHFWPHGIKALPNLHFKLSNIYEYISKYLLHFLFLILTTSYLETGGLHYFDLSISCSIFLFLIFVMFSERERETLLICSNYGNTTLLLIVVSVLSEPLCHQWYDAGCAVAVLLGTHSRFYYIIYYDFKIISYICWSDMSVTTVLLILQ